MIIDPAIKKKGTKTKSNMIIPCNRPLKNPNKALIKEWKPKGERLTISSTIPPKNPTTCPFIDPRLTAKNTNKIKARSGIIPLTAMKSNNVVCSKVIPTKINVAKNTGRYSIITIPKFYQPDLDSTIG